MLRNKAMLADAHISSLGYHWGGALRDDTKNGCVAD